MMQRNETTLRKLPLREKLALLKLSLRSFFWTIDGNTKSRELRYRSVWLWILAWGMIVELLLYAVVIPISTLLNIMHPKIFFAGILSSLNMMFILSVVFLNFRRARYNIKYLKSAWYRNTGILPSEVISDKGVYGEYYATVCEEELLRKNNVKGYIFNGLIIPKEDGDFAEIDLVSVSELGIHVIEAKGRTGTFVGSAISKEWTQVLGDGIQNKMENPLLQNYNHINYLVEYLARELQGNPLLNHLSDDCHDIVVFGTQGASFQMDQNMDLIGSWYYGCADHYVKTYPSTSKLTPRDVKTIANVLNRLPIYTGEEKRRMIQMRAIGMERGDFRHRIQYHLAYTRNNDDGTVFYTIVKDNGFYQWFYIMNCDIFIAIPCFEILSIEKTSGDLSYIISELRQMDAD